MIVHFSCPECEARLTAEVAPRELGTSFYDAVTANRRREALSIYRAIQHRVRQMAKAQ